MPMPENSAEDVFDNLPPASLTIVRQDGAVVVPLPKWSDPAEETPPDDVGWGGQN